MAKGGASGIEGCESHGRNTGIANVAKVVRTPIHTPNAVSLDRPNFCAITLDLHPSTRAGRWSLWRPMICASHARLDAIYRTLDPRERDAWATRAIQFETVGSPDPT
jgi:hypothetical protein